MVAQAVNPFCQPRQRQWVLEKQKALTGSACRRREGGQQGQDGTSTHEASKPRRAHYPTGHNDYKGRESRTNTSELYPAQSQKADKINTFSNLRVKGDRGRRLGETPSRGVQHPASFEGLTLLGDGRLLARNRATPTL